MSAPLPLFITCFIAYLIGAIPTSFIFARALKGVDIREHGSGNAGATNVFRVVGKLPGLITLIFDILKGVVAVSLVSSFFLLLHKGKLNNDTLRVLFGFLAICGHIWTPFLKFKGGKGVATTIGVLVILSQKLALWFVIIWAIVFILKRYVSLASIAAAVTLPLLTLIFDLPLSYSLFSVSVCIIISYRHKENIKRLVNGVEPKTKIFGSKKIDVQ